MSGKNVPIEGYRTIPVLVTGAEGFIGSALARRLVREGARVSALIHPDAPRGRLDGLESAIGIYPVDIRDRTAVQEAIRKIAPRRVFHLAAMTDVSRDWRKIDEALAVNLGGTVNLIAALSRVDYEIMISACTAEAYGRNPAPFREEMSLDPISPYSFSKPPPPCLAGWPPRPWEHRSELCGSFSSMARARAWNDFFPS